MNRDSMLKNPRQNTQKWAWNGILARDAFVIAMVFVCLCKIARI